MSTELKMSDVFKKELSVRREDVCFDDHCPSIGDKGEMGVYGAFVSMDQAKYVAHAVNNHDRLVEGLEQLRKELEQLRNLVHSVQGMCIADSRGEINFDSKEVARMITSVTNLTYAQMSVMLNQD